MSNSSTYLEWKNLNYSVSKKKFNYRKFKNIEEKSTILCDANGSIRSGQLVAILGSSGAGKTSLLAAISQRIRDTVAGTIFINNVHVTRKQMIKQSSFVPQFDITPEGLTAREHLYFMCELRLDKHISKNEKIEKIADIMWRLGLNKVFDTQTALLSGGERKILNLATELLTDPNIIFCDEPTTGLDSYSALSVIKSLKRLTTDVNSYPNKMFIQQVEKCSREQDNLIDSVEMEILPEQMVKYRKKAIICSIHQPTSSVFECFSHFILMSAGRIVFQGTSDQAFELFTNLGFTCPPAYNPAEFYVNIVSNKSIKLADKKSNNKLITENGFHNRSADYLESAEQLFSRIRWIYQVYILIQRSFIESRRTLKDHFLRSSTFIITSISIALVYMSVKGNIQQSIQDINGFVFTITAEIIFANSYSVIFFYPSKLPILRRETGERIYDLSAYYIATIICFIPKSLIESYIFIGIIYAFVGFARDFWLFLKLGITLAITSIAANAYGMMLSGMLESTNLTAEISPPFDLIMFLISGFYVKFTTFSFVKYFSIFFYALESLSILIWNGIPAIDCNEKSEGYCLHNGTEVLRSLNYGTTVDTVWLDYLGLTVLAAIMHFIGFLGVRKMINKFGYY